MSNVSRRTFLTTTAAGAGFTIVPRHVLASASGPQRHGQHRHHRIRRHRRQQHASAHESEHRGDLRRGRLRSSSAVKRMVDDAASAPASPQQPQPQPAMSKARVTANDAPTGRQRGGASALHERADPAAEAIRDYREMLDKQKDVDAISSRRLITCMRSSRMRR